MSQLLTQHPIAIRILMSETIFSSSDIDELTDRSLKDHNLTQSEDILFEDANPDLLFWGSNEKKVSFLIRNSAFEYFSTEAEDAFLKTLTALKLTINDVSVVNLANNATSFDEIKKVLNSKFYIYCEGENEENRNFFNRLFEKDGLTFLYTYSFEEMLTDVTKKRTFWNAIKEIKVS
jgi:hypothetical protein